MTELIRLLTSVAGVTLYAAAGLGLTELVPRLRRRPVAERLGWGWLLGVAFVTGGCFVASHLFGAPLRRHVILPIALAPTFLGIAHSWLERRTIASTQQRPPRDRRHTILFFVVLALSALATIALFAEASTNPIRDWDGRMTWSTQARYFREAGSVSPRALTEERWYVSHPQYPPLLPLMQVGVMEVFNVPDDERVPRVLYAAFLPAYLLVLFFAAQRWAGRRAALMTTLVAVLAPFLVFASHGGPAGCYSDFPLACFLGAGLLSVLSASGGVWAGMTGGLLLGAAVLAKNEGFPLAIAVLFAGLVLALGRLIRGLRRRAVARFVSPVIVATLLTGAAFALLTSWRTGIPNRFDERYELLLKARPPKSELVAHLQSALPVMVSKSFLRADWGILWVVVPLVLLAGRRGLRIPASVPLLAAVAAPLALGMAVYAVHWDPAGLAEVTWNRFLLDGSLPLFVLVALAFRPLTERRIRGYFF